MTEDGGDGPTPGREVTPGISRLRSAIFLDFDNVFSGLMDLDEGAAMAFAQRPEEWLGRLRVHRLPPFVRREFLIRRCYLNPAGWKVVAAQGEAPQRVYFSRFRPFLTRLGFDVVDCPSLTSRGKNAADIRIALDVIDALGHDTRFDEFVLLSGDADFTPVLQRVREHDRRTVVVSSNQTARAYEAMVDLFLDEQNLIELIRPEESSEPVTAVMHELAADSVGSADATVSDVDVEALRKRAIDLTLAMIAEADRPVLLTAIAKAIRTELGEIVDSTGWFGRGTLSGAVTDPATSRFRRSQHHMWDPDRHEAPTSREEIPLPDGISEIAAVTGMPRLSSESYRAAFAALAAWVAANPFNLTAITRDVRDHLREDGHDIGRQTLGFIVRGSMYGGVPLNRDPPPDASEISRAFLTSIEQSAASARLELSDQDVVALRKWVQFS